MSRIDLHDVTSIAEVGMSLANLLARAAVGYQQWHALAEAARAAGRGDFTQAELDAIHGAMHATTDRFLNRDFGAEPPPERNF